MRFHAPLEQILRGRSSLRVTKTLLAHPRKPFTGRELAREAEVSPSDAAAALKTLEAHGVVRRRTIGRAHEWRLNTAHFLVEPLNALLTADTQGLPRLRDLVRRHLGAQTSVIRAVLYGSVARGEDAASSDIDLLIVVRTPRDKTRLRDVVRALREQIETTFTNPLNEVIYSADEYQAKRHLPLIKSIEKEGDTVLGTTHAQEDDAPARSAGLPGQSRGIPSSQPKRPRTR